MNRSLASKTKVVSRVVRGMSTAVRVARVASTAVADSKSQVSRACSPGRAVSKSLGRVSRASAKVTALRQGVPRLCPGTPLVATHNRLCGLRSDEAHFGAIHHGYCRL